MTGDIITSPKTFLFKLSIIKKIKEVIDFKCLTYKFIFLKKEGNPII